MFKYILAAWLAASSLCLAGIGISGGGATASSASTLTNGQVQATNVANDSIGPAQTTAQMMYRTNSAIWSVTIQPQTGQWYKVATLGAGQIARRTFFVQYSIGSGFFAWMEFSVTRNNASGGDLTLGDVHMRSPTTNGFGAVAIDGSQQVFVQITNLSHAAVTASGFTMGWSLDTPDAAMTLTFATNAITDASGTKLYMTPGDWVTRDARGDFDVVHVGTLNVDSNTIYLGSTRLSDSNGLLAVSSGMTVAGDQTVLGSGFIGVGMTNPASALTVDGDMWSTSGWMMAHNGFKNRTNILVFTNGLNLNGSAVGSSSGGGAYAYQGTNNIAPTNGLNTISANSVLSSIGGGISNGVIDGPISSVIGGGSSNLIQAIYAIPTDITIAGGNANTIIDAYAGTISGGKKNKIQSMGVGNNIAGGGYNEIITSGGGYNSILGGGDASYQNRILGAGTYSTIVGGYNSRITNACNWSLVGNGDDHQIGAANFATILNGESDTILDADYASILGGQNNSIASGATGSSIVNGHLHSIGGAATFSTVSGGYDNDIGASATYATVGGGQTNKIAASAIGATIPGGIGNMVDAPYGFAAGKSAQAAHASVFIWADNQGAQFASTATNQFLIRASGGVRIASFGGGQDTNTWAVTGMRIVTNANVFLHTPAWQGSQLLDVGSNRIYYAVGLTTNDWKGTNLN